MIQTEGGTHLNTPNRSDHSPHPKPNGEMVEFYLARTVRGVQIPGSGQPIQVTGLNGHDYTIKFGSRNTVPREVYELFKNAQSRTIQSLEDRQRLAPRSADSLGLNYGTETICDYEIELIKEGK